MTWPPPEVGKETMNKNIAIILMAAIALALIGVGALLISGDNTAAGWVLLVVGALATLSTVGVLARETK